MTTSRCEYIVWQFEHSHRQVFKVTPNFPRISSPVSFFAFLGSPLFSTNQANKICFCWGPFFLQPSKLVWSGGLDLDLNLDLEDKWEATKPQGSKTPKFGSQKPEGSMLLDLSQRGLGTSMFGGIHFGVSSFFRTPPNMSVFSFRLPLNTNQKVLPPKKRQTHSANCSTEARFFFPRGTGPQKTQLQQSSQDQFGLLEAQANRFRRGPD